MQDRTVNPNLLNQSLGQDWQLDPVRSIPRLLEEIHIHSESQELKIRITDNILYVITKTRKIRPSPFPSGQEMKCCEYVENITGVE